MWKFLETVKIVVALYPILMETVKRLEEALPEPGHGPKKLEQLKAILAASYDKMDDAKMKFEEVWPSINMVVTAIVTMLNTTEWLKKK